MQATTNARDEIIEVDKAGETTSVCAPTTYSSGKAVLGQALGFAATAAEADRIARGHGYDCAEIDTSYGGRRYVCVELTEIDVSWEDIARWF